MTEADIDNHAEARSNGRRWLLMINCLVLTRITDTKNDSGNQQSPAASEGNSAGEGSSAGDDNFSGEVNAYIRNLLVGFSNPQHADQLLPHIFDYDVDLLRRIRAAGEATIRYALCKTEDDLVVLSAAVFDSSDAGGASQFKHGAQGQMGRSGAHYYFAFSYVNAVASVPAAIATVLERIEIGLDKYATILAYITGKPFDLAARLSAGEAYYLARSVETAGKQVRLDRKKDEFLDAYLEWRERRTADARRRMIRIAQELHQLDPTFTCDIAGTQ